CASTSLSLVYPRIGFRTTCRTLQLLNNSEYIFFTRSFTPSNSAGFDENSELNRFTRSFFHVFGPSLAGAYLLRKLLHDLSDVRSAPFGHETQSPAKDQVIIGGETPASRRLLKRF